MKVFISIVVFMSFSLLSPDLSQIRKAYPNASKSEEIVDQLFNALSSVDKNADEVLIAYKGAVSTLRAKYAKGIKDKKEFFKTGTALIEYAIQAKPKDVEIRCIRLSVQENSPKILKYKSNITEDKQFILANYKTIPSEEVRVFVKNFTSQSSIFSEAEKQLF